jgi:hypothetical protein
LKKTEGLFIVGGVFGADHCSHPVRIGFAMQRIKGIPEFDRPREKMQQKGPAALSNPALLGVLPAIPGKVQILRFSVNL